MKFEDEHRIFLQGIMTKGILSFEEVVELFKVAYDYCQIEVPENKTERNNKLVELINRINNQIEFMELSIVRIVDEDFKDKKTFYALVSRLDRSKDTSMLTKKAMVSFAPHELEYLKIVTEAILDSDQKEIDNISALNLTREVKTKSIRNNEGEVIINKFIDKGQWLKKTREGTIRFAPRFIAEMEPYLTENYPDQIAKCDLCKKIVIRAIGCGNECNAKYHLYCLAPPKGQTKSVCKVCREEAMPEKNLAGKRKRNVNTREDSSDSE